MIVVLALAGPALATFGFVLALFGVRCDCRSCTTYRANGWRCIAYGCALVVAAWLVAPWPL